MRSARPVKSPALRRLRSNWICCLWAGSSVASAKRRSAWNQPVLTHGGASQPFTESIADREARHSGGREVGVMKIIAVERRDRIGMRNEIALRRKGAHDRPDDGAGGSVVLRTRGNWVDVHDDE